MISMVCAFTDDDEAAEPVDTFARICLRFFRGKFGAHGDRGAVVGQ